MEKNVLITQQNKYKVPHICYLNSATDSILALFMLAIQRGKDDSDTNKNSKL